MALRNSAHVGRLGDWVELAAALGCVSFHFVNTLSMPRVAPWGGREGRLSTNPLAWDVPIAEGWIVDGEGKSTTDAAALYDGGLLLPLGGLAAGHKGYALSLMVDLMAGAIKSLKDAAHAGAPVKLVADFMSTTPPN